MNVITQNDSALASNSYDWLEPVGRVESPFIYPAIKGRQDMAGDVSSMASFGDGTKNAAASWHGQESFFLNQPSSVSEILQKGGIPEYESHPMLILRNGVLEESPIRATTTSDGAFVGHNVSAEIHTPAEIVAPILAICQSMPDQWQFDNVLSLYGDSVFSALARGIDRTIVGDNHKVWLSGNTSFNGQFATRFGLVLERIVCSNTMNHAYDDCSILSKLTVRHSTSLPDGDELLKILQFVAHEANRIEEEAEHFVKHFFSKEEAGELLLSFMPERTVTMKDFIDPEDGKTKSIAFESTNKGVEKRRQAMLECLVTSLDERGGECTAWTVLQAATRYANHVQAGKKGSRTVNDSQEQREVHRVMFGSGNLFMQNANSKLRELTGYTPSIRALDLVP